MAAIMAMTGCNQSNNQNTTQMNSEPLKEVAGRKNFGATAMRDDCHLG